MKPDINNTPQDINGQMLLTIQVPEHPDFPDKAKGLGGIYDGDANRWQFPIGKAGDVQQLVDITFGEKDDKALGEKDKPSWSLEETGDHVVVKGPYNREFVDMARAIGGNFDPESKSWTFNRDQKVVVTKMCKYAFDGTVPRKSMKEAFSQAMSKAAAALSGWGKAAMVVGKVGALLASYGYSGNRGMSTTMSMINIAAGTLPKPKPDGLIGNTPMNAGGHVAFLEQMQEHQRQTAPGLGR